MTTSANLLLPDMEASQNEKEVTFNQAKNDLDLALTNLLSAAMADADVTLTTGEGNQALANMVFLFTGTNTAARNVIVPTNKKLYIVKNGTTGGFKITVKTSGGTGVDILASDGYVVTYCDGTNVVKVGGSGSGSAIGGVSSKTADYTLVSGDNGTLVVLASGSHTFTPAAVSASMFVGILNVGSGTLTLSHNSKNINGAAADVSLAPGAGGFLFSDGTNYFFLSGGAGGSAIGGVLTKTADYTVLSGDKGKLVVLLSGSHTFTPPAPDAAFYCFFSNAGSGTLTISHNGHNIDGAASDLALAQNEGVTFFSDGTDYFSEDGIGGSGGSSTLSGLSDVSLSSPADGQVLTYESSSSLWKNKNAAGGGGAAFQTLQRSTIIIADGTTTTLQVQGDQLTATAGTLAAVAASSTVGPTVEYPPSGGPGQLSLHGNVNHVAGRHCKFLFKGYFSTTGDDLLWLGLFSLVGNYLTNIGRSTAPNASGNDVSYAAFRLANKSGSSLETTWHACTGNSDGSSNTASDTGVTQDTSEHTFAIVCDDDNSQVLFYIDGVLKATVTTNLPAANTPMGWFVGAYYASTPPTTGVGLIRVDSDL